MNNQDYFNDLLRSSVTERSAASIAKEYLEAKLRRSEDVMVLLTQLDYSLDQSSFGQHINAKLIENGLRSDSVICLQNGAFYYIRDLALCMWKEIHQSSDLSTILQPAVTPSSGTTLFKESEVSTIIAAFNESLANIQIYCKALMAIGMGGTADAADRFANLTLDNEKLSSAYQKIQAILSANQLQSACHLISSVVSSLTDGIVMTPSVEEGTFSVTVMNNDSDEYTGEYGLVGIIADILPNFDSIQAFMLWWPEAGVKFLNATWHVITAIAAAVWNVIWGGLSTIFKPLLNPNIVSVNSKAKNSCFDICVSGGSFNINSLPFNNSFDYLEHVIDSTGDEITTRKTANSSNIQTVIQEMAGVTASTLFHETLVENCLYCIESLASNTYFVRSGETIYYYKFQFPISGELPINLLPRVNGESITNNLSLSNLVEYYTTNTIDRLISSDNDEIINGTINSMILDGLYNSAIVHNYLSDPLNREAWNVYTRTGNDFIQLGGLDFPHIEDAQMTSDHKDRLSFGNWAMHGSMLLDDNRRTNKDIFDSLCNHGLNDVQNANLILPQLLQMCLTRSIDSWNHYMTHIVAGYSYFYYFSYATNSTPTDGRYHLLTDQEIDKNMVQHFKKIFWSTVAIVGISYYGFKILPAARKTAVAASFSIPYLDFAIGEAIGKGQDASKLIAQRKSMNLKRKLAIALGGYILNPLANSIEGNNEVPDYKDANAELSKEIQEVIKLIR